MTRSTGTFPHSGIAYMILTGVNSTSGTLYQQVTIPSGTSPSLNFWLNITTSEAAGAYVLRGPYSLSSFAGQTVRIQFRATNDITLPTSFRVDDVSVK